MCSLLYFLSPSLPLWKCKLSWQLFELFLSELSQQLILLNFFCLSSQPVLSIRHFNLIFFSQQTHTCGDIICKLVILSFSFFSCISSDTNSSTHCVSNKSSIEIPCFFVWKPLFASNEFYSWKKNNMTINTKRKNQKSKQNHWISFIPFQWKWEKKAEDIQCQWSFVPTACIKVD